MRFSTTIVASILSFAITSYAWIQAPDGTWVANNVYFNTRGVRVHEACTTRNTNDIHVNVPCTYWTDGDGHQFKGTCKHTPGLVDCV